jgi:hypothetical protein
MKHIVKLTFTLFVLFCTSIYGQQYGRPKPNNSNTNNSNSIRLNLYGAYAFQDSFDSYYDYGSYYQGQLQDGIQYGAGIDFEIKPNSHLEFLYLREDSNAPTQYYDGGIYDKYADFDVALNYVMLGGTRSFRQNNSPVEGFGGLMAGIAVIDIQNPKNNYSQNATKFAWGIKAGAIIWATNNLGIKLQGQLLSVAQSVGGGVYFGTGGPGAGISSYSSLYQFTLGGGLVFDFGK